ncbi:MAG: sugar O-acyltransferase (sialic acid O-acetyltransferase NeuD family) [Vicingaceae bacterium]|jgi:sugar O-acyltransferase (sialic acid O-acetyltransferase NeuD family)
MLIIGTGGLAKDIAGNVSRHYDQAQYVFYNDSYDLDEPLFLGRYKVLTSKEQAAEFFQEVDKKFIAAIGNPLMRMRLNKSFKELGGTLESFTFTEPKYISDFTKIGKGSVIQCNVIISSNTSLGEGNFINCGCIIGHDVTIADYVSLGPGVHILGNVSIGEYSYIGTGAIVMPGVKIGKKVKIAPGKIISEDIPDNSKIN